MTLFLTTALGQQEVIGAPVDPPASPKQIHRRSNDVVLHYHAFHLSSGVSEGNEIPIRPHQDRVVGDCYPAPTRPKFMEIERK